MATKSILKRGFKASSERLAIEYRKKLDIEPNGALCAFKLAEHLGVSVYKATEFITSENEIGLLSGSIGINCGWSALNMKTKLENRIIIYNPFHSDGRQQSDLMHELAHIICEHERSESDYDFPIPLGMRYYNEEQEEEAKCLGATLQITREGLLWALKNRMPTEEVATYFNASSDMVTYRMNTSGVIKQLSYRRR